MSWLLAQADSAEVVKTIVNGADGRTDTTFLATTILAIGGVALLAIVSAMCFWLPRHIEALMANCRTEQAELTNTFRGEMERERQFHANERSESQRFHQQQTDKIAEAVRYLGEAIDGRRTKRKGSEDALAS